MLWRDCLDNLKDCEILINVWEMRQKIVIFYNFEVNEGLITKSKVLTKKMATCAHSMIDYVFEIRWTQMDRDKILRIVNEILSKGKRH